MSSKLKILFLSVIGSVLVGITFPAITSAMPASMTQVAGGNPACASNFLTFPVWYRGIVDGDCNVQVDDEFNFVWVVVLNIAEMLMHAVGYVAVVFIIVGGYKYMTSFGEPDRLAQAKNTIKNAIIGLVIALVSVAIVNFIVGAVT